MLDCIIERQPLVFWTLVLSRQLSIFPKSLKKGGGGGRRLGGGASADLQERGVLRVRTVLVRVRVVLVRVGNGGLERVGREVPIKICILFLLLLLNARVGLQGLICGSFEDCLLARARLDLQQALQVNSEKSVPSYFYYI